MPNIRCLNLASEAIVLPNKFPAIVENMENRPKMEGFIEIELVNVSDYLEKGPLLFLLNATQYELEVRNTQTVISSAKAEVTSAQIDGVITTYYPE